MARWVTIGWMMWGLGVTACGGGGAPGADAEDDVPTALFCSPGVAQTFCPSPTTIVACSPEGDRWIETSCRAGAFCLAGRCEALACPPGRVGCSDARTLSACVEDGDGGHGWRPVEVCNGACIDGGCVEACSFDSKPNIDARCHDFVLELAGAAGADCDGAGRLAVPSSGDSRIALFDLQAEPPVALPGSPFETCEDPSRILLTRGGDVIATCRGDGRVQRHAPDGQVRWGVRLPDCDAVRGAVVGSGDRLFVGCTNTRRAHELDPDTGAVLDSLFTGVDIYGMAADEEGFYVTDFGSLAKISAVGGLDILWRVSANGYGIATDDRGRVWLAEAPGLVAYDGEDGSELEAIPIRAPDSGELSYCNGVTVALDGRIIVGCGETGDFIAIYDPDSGGLEVVSLPEGARHPRGVAVDPEGSIYTINLESQDVTRLGDARAPLAFGGGALVAPYGYSGDMTGLGACLFAGRTRWRSGALTGHEEGTTHWRRVAWRADVPEGTSLIVRFRLDDGPWVEILSGMDVDAVATTLEIEAELGSGATGVAATLHELAVYYDK